MCAPDSSHQNWTRLTLEIGIPNAGNFGNSALTAQYAHGGHESVLQRDGDLLHLQTVFQRAEPGLAKVKALKALNAETEKRARVDGAVRQAVRNFLGQPEFLLLLQVCFLALVPFSAGQGFAS